LITAVVEAEPQVAVESPVTAMDIRIGSIISCEKHPEADR
jgi:tRNA-binding EMAP/Myf-like protein